VKTGDLPIHAAKLAELGAKHAETQGLAVSVTAKATLRAGVEHATGEYLAALKVDSENRSRRSSGAIRRTDDLVRLASTLGRASIAIKTVAADDMSMVLLSEALSKFPPLDEWTPSVPRPVDENETAQDSDEKGAEEKAIKDAEWNRIDWNISRRRWLDPDLNPDGQVKTMIIQITDQLDWMSKSIIFALDQQKKNQNNISKSVKTPSRERELWARLSFVWAVAFPSYDPPLALRGKDGTYGRSGEAFRAWLLNVAMSVGRIADGEGIKTELGGLATPHRRRARDLLDDRLDRELREQEQDHDERAEDRARPS
jgi:hypothetical protein